MSQNPLFATTEASHTHAELDELLKRQKAYAPTSRDTTYRERREKLGRIQRYLDQPDNVDRLIAALKQDFGKPEVETITSELAVVYSHLKHVRANLKRWMEPKKLPGSPATAGITSYLYLEPKGCTLIVSPWNYPFNLAVIPLIYAISAGCTAIVKPSEMSPATTQYIQLMLAELFEEQEVAVVTGQGDTAAHLTSLPFDHIFFTGSPAVGKKVMAAAAKNLTSVTLELGGKSPAVIDREVKQRKSAENTVWGKCFNAGQTCIAPDYLLVHDQIFSSYVTELTGAIERFYGPDPKASDSYARIINHRHFDRLKNLFDDAVGKGATVVFGGQFDREQRYVAPTILTDVTEEMDILHEEIFGPLWPVMSYSQLDEAIQFINARPKALSFYIQSNNRTTINELKRRTSSGGLLVNEYLLGGGTAQVPFGGVNNSGIGKSFGYHGFVEFSNERALMERKWFDLSVAYPPYTDFIREGLRRVYRWM